MISISFFMTAFLISLVFISPDCSVLSSSEMLLSPWKVLAVSSGYFWGLVLRKPDSKSVWVSSIMRLLGCGRVGLED